MKQLFAVLTVVAVGASMAGCARVTARVVEKPRVDQEMTSGNRGYVQGTGPAAAPRKTTRQVLETDIEMATSREMTPWKIKKNPPAAEMPQAAVPAPAPAAAWPQESPASKSASAAPEMPAAPKTYIVKKGDTLEKIAAEMYGDGSKWRRIFKANKEMLKSPNKIYAGQKLMIPALPAEKGVPSAQDQWK